MKRVLTITLTFVILGSHATCLMAANKKGTKQIAGPVQLSPIEQGAVNAVENCDTVALKLLLSKGVSPNLKINSNGNDLFSRLPIRLGPFERCADTFTLLVTSGADLNHKNSDGNSVTQAAAIKLNVPKATLELMTQYGSKFTDTRKCPKNDSYCIAGRTPLMDLVEDGVLNQLIVPGYNYSRDTLEHFRYIAEKSNINARDVKGQTALHIATKDAKINIVKYLIAEGANPNIKDVQGLTAKDLALSSGNSSLIGIFNK